MSRRKLSALLFLSLTSLASLYRVAPTLGLEYLFEPSRALAPCCPRQRAKIPLSLEFHGGSAHTFFFKPGHTDRADLFFEMTKNRFGFHGRGLIKLSRTPAGDFVRVGDSYLHTPELARRIREALTPHTLLGAHLSVAESQNPLSLAPGHDQIIRQLSVPQAQWDTEAPRWHLLRKDPVFLGSSVIRASLGFDFPSGKPFIRLQVKLSAWRNLVQTSRQTPESVLAFVLGEKVYATSHVFDLVQSATPHAGRRHGWLEASKGLRIRSDEENASIQLRLPGDYDMDEARTIASILNAGRGTEPDDSSYQYVSFLAGQERIDSHRKSLGVLLGSVLLVLFLRFPRKIAYSGLLFGAGSLYFLTLLKFLDIPLSSASVLGIHLGVLVMGTTLGELLDAPSAHRTATRFVLLGLPLALVLHGPPRTTWIVAVLGGLCSLGLGLWDHWFRSASLAGSRA